MSKDNVIPVFISPHSEPLPLESTIQNDSERENSVVAIETTRYVRKPFYIDAAQVTAENLESIAAWVESEVREDTDGTKYVKVRVHRPLNDRQTKAYVGDWVLKAGGGFKVFTPKAFIANFELAEDEPIEKAS